MSSENDNVALNLGPKDAKNIQLNLNDDEYIQSNLNFIADQTGLEIGHIVQKAFDLGIRIAGVGTGNDLGFYSDTLLDSQKVDFWSSNFHNPLQMKEGYPSSIVNFPEKISVVAEKVELCRELTSGREMYPLHLANRAYKAGLSIIAEMIEGEEFYFVNLGIYDGDTIFVEDDYDGDEDYDEEGEYEDEDDYDVYLPREVFKEPYDFGSLHDNGFVKGDY